MFVIIKYLGLSQIVTVEEQFYYYLPVMNLRLHTYKIRSLDKLKIIIFK